MDPISHAPGSKSLASHGPVPQRRFARAWLPAVAALLGAGVWLAPSESEAAPRCTSKPAVCARLAAERKARSEPARVVASTPAPAVVARAAAPRCTSKPIVCARQRQLGIRPAPLPVTLARSEADGARCTSKPAVCARLRMRPSASPVTLASDPLR